jgi:hypothetical protein
MRAQVVAANSIDPSLSDVSPVDVTDVVEF